MNWYKRADAKTYKQFQSAVELANKLKEAILVANNADNPKTKRRARSLMEKCVKMIENDDNYRVLLRIARVEYNFEPCLDYLLHLVYFMLAKMYRKDEFFKEATELYKKAEQMMDYILVPDYSLKNVNDEVICELFPVSLQRRAIIDALADIYVDQGRYCKGEPYFRKSLLMTFEDKSMKMERKMYESASPEDIMSLMRDKRRDDKEFNITKQEFIYPVRKKDIAGELLQLNTLVEDFLDEGEEELCFG
jgi:tetratricopeptide (TPR) repeat protein